MLTNGSIYIDMAQLSAGAAAPARAARRADARGRRARRSVDQAGLAATFSPASTVPDDELLAQWELISRDDGHRLLPRLIRYIEERRRDEARFTGAIETHPSPLHVVWGVDDPIAVVAMTDTLPRRGPTPSSNCSTASGTTR